MIASFVRVRSALLDHLVRPLKERRRDRQAQGLDSLEVDDQFDFRNLLDRQVGRLLALEDTAGVDANQTVPFRQTATVAHHSTGGGEVATLIDSGYPVPERQCAELFFPA